MKYGMLLATVLVLALLPGCVTVNQKMLPQVGVGTPPKAPGVVAVEYGPYVQLENGKEYVSCCWDTPKDYAASSVTDQLMRRWKHEGIISDYGIVDTPGVAAPYTLTVSGSENMVTPAYLSFLSSATSEIIPSAYTTTYDLVFQFVNNRTHKQYTVKAKNAYVRYEELLLIPVAPFFAAGHREALDDVADYLYAELRKQGAF